MIVNFFNVVLMFYICHFSLNLYKLSFLELEFPPPRKKLLKFIELECCIALYKRIVRPGIDLSNLQTNDSMHFSYQSKLYSHLLFYNLYKLKSKTHYF